MLDAIRHHPQSFPIPGDKDFELNATVTLRFCGTRNPVHVKKIDVTANRASMLLETEPGHFFSGTAEHIARKHRDGRLLYEIIGHGPKDGELSDRHNINMEFGRYMWPPLVRRSVVPLARSLQQGR